MVNKLVSYNIRPITHYWLYAAAKYSNARAIASCYILRVLEDTGWLISGERGAAAILGLNPSTLRSHMQKLDIRKAGLHR